MRGCVLRRDRVLASIDTASPRPLKGQSAYDMLKRRIITLEIPPGAPLDERELKDKLGIGRTPLREAMLRLSHERMIVHVPRRGARVSELSIFDLQEMIEARSHIEPLVTLRAAERAADTDIRYLESLIERAEAAVDAGDVESTIDDDLEFHTAIARMNGNRYFATTAEQINTALLRYWYISFTGPAGLANSFGHHRKILEAIAARDPGLARARALEHIEIFRSRMGDLIV